MPQHFTVIGKITNIEVIAAGAEIKTLPRLIKEFGKGSWKKYKGVAMIRFENGSTRTAEIHWYEAHGIGKKRMKTKVIIGER